MAKAEKIIEQLTEHIMVVCSIECSVCKKTAEEYNTDDEHFAESLFYSGWNAKYNIVNCPDCAAKLKVLLKKNKEPENGI